MQRIKFYAAGLAVILAVCSAFAPSKSGTFDGKYQNKGPDGAYYILGTNVTGETPGSTTYQCNSNPSSPCTVEVISADIVSRNGNQEIPVADAGNLVSGDFQDNH